MIFETQRLAIRKLMMKDLLHFHEMQSNPKVMQFVTGDVKTLDEHKIELNSLIKKYDFPNNDFWIYSVIRKQDNIFVGTVAFVKDKNDDEIGYRFLEKFWGFGYGFELVEGILKYCKSIKINRLIAYVVDENIASKKILEKLNFKKVTHFVSEDLGLPETKYQIEL